MNSEFRKRVGHRVSLEKFNSDRNLSFAPDNTPANNSLEVVFAIKDPSYAQKEFWKALLRFLKRNGVDFVRILCWFKHLDVPIFIRFLATAHREGLLENIFVRFQDVDKYSLETIVKKGAKKNGEEYYLLNASVDCSLVDWFKGTGWSPTKFQNLEMRRGSAKQLRYVLNNVTFGHLQASLIQLQGVTKRELEDLIVKRGKSVTMRILNSTAEEKLYDCFLSHCWGKEKKNHERIVELSKRLEEMGVSPWIDEANMHMHLDQMREGIDSSAVFVAFVTEDFLDKAGVQETNIAKEVGYASREKKPFLVVIMEPILDMNERISQHFGSLMVEKVDFSEEAVMEKNFHFLITAIKKLSVEETSTRI